MLLVCHSPCIPWSPPSSIPFLPVVSLSQYASTHLIDLMDENQTSVGAKSTKGTADRGENVIDPVKSGIFGVSTCFLITDENGNKPAVVPGLFGSKLTSCTAASLPLESLWKLTAFRPSYSTLWVRCDLVAMHLHSPRRIFIRAEPIFLSHRSLCKSEPTPLFQMSLFATMISFALNQLLHFTFLVMTGSSFCLLYYHIKAG